MQINDLKNQLEELANADITQLPGFKAMVILAKQFRKLGLPIKHIGKIKIEVSESFFDDEALAEEIIKIFAEVLLKVRNAIEEEFGEDAKEVFIDTMKGMSLTYNG